MNIKLFSGTAHPGLAAEVAQHLGIELSPVEVVRFDNSEVRVTVQEDVKNSTCVVIQTVSNPTDTRLMELFLLCDALRREEAARVVGIVPYFGYARQNIQHRPGECVSANVVIRFMEAIGFHKIYTVDLHDDSTAGVFSIPFKNITVWELFAQRVQEYVKNQQPSTDEFVIVSPDQGGVERARLFGTAFYGDDDFHMAVTEKKRDKNRTHQSKALDLYGDVDGKTCIIVDDIATSAGTLVHASELCMEQGAERVLAVVTHHDFSERAPQRLLDSPIERFFSSNSIQLTDTQKIEKLEEVSIAGLIAAEIGG